MKITKVSNFICSQSSAGGYYNQAGFPQDYNNQGYNQNYSNQAYGNQQSHDSYDDYYQQFDGRQSNKRQGYMY